MANSDYRTRVTRHLIRKAFLTLLQRKPIQDISIKELCAEAGISRGTFYAHYTDIYYLLQKLEQEMMEDVRQELAKMLEGTPKDTIHVTVSLFRCLQENADLCTVALSPYGDQKFTERLLSIGQEYYVEAYQRYFADATPKQLQYYYAFVSRGCMGLLQQWLSDGMTSSPEEMADMAENMMKYGIGFFRRPEKQQRGTGR